MYGVWISATLARPGDTIVLDNKAVTKVVTHEPHLEASDYDLHHASYSPITAKQLTVGWARGHRDPKKAHNLQDYQDRIGNEPADEEAKEASTMHPGKGMGSESPANILLNNHAMPSPARKWIINARPQKLSLDAHWTSWLPLFAVNHDRLGLWLWGIKRWLRYGAPWETLPVLFPRCNAHHGMAVQECLLFCRVEALFWTIWRKAWEVWRPKIERWLWSATEDGRRMCTPLQVPVSLQRSFSAVPVHITRRVGEME